MKIEPSFCQKYFSCCKPKCCQKKQQQQKKVKIIAREKFNVEQDLKPVPRHHKNLKSTDMVSLRDVLKQKK